MARIIGTGSYLPNNVVTNKDLETLVDTSDEWIKTRTGISSRHYAGKDENTGEMGLSAAKKAMAMAKVTKEEISYILVATTTPESLVPSTSAYIQGKLGAKNAACLDLNAACSGFIYGLQVAQGLLSLPGIEKILLIGSEVLTKITDFTDRSTCVLFGDGAGAVILEKGQGIHSVITGADGTQGACLHTGTFKVENPMTKEVMGPQKIYMDGQEVYKFAVRILPEALRQVVAKGGGDLGTLTHVIPHQANLRIIQGAAKKLDMPLEKFFVNIEQVGNTSAASIAIALDEANRQGRLQKGDTLAMVGFGGGLTYGACYMTWTL